MDFKYYQTFPSLVWESKFYHTDSSSIVKSFIVYGIILLVWLLLSLCSGIELHTRKINFFLLVDHKIDFITPCAVNKSIFWGASTKRNRARQRKNIYFTRVIEMKDFEEKLYNNFYTFHEIPKTHQQLWMKKSRRWLKSSF